MLVRSWSGPRRLPERVRTISSPFLGWLYFLLQANGAGDDETSERSGDERVRENSGL